MNIKAADGPSTAELRAEITEMWESLAKRCTQVEMNGYQHAGEAVQDEVINNSQGVIYEQILLVTRLEEAQMFLNARSLDHCREERDRMRDLQDLLTDWMNNPPPPEPEAPPERAAPTPHAIARRPGGRQSTWGARRAVRRPGGPHRP